MGASGNLVPTHNGRMAACLTAAIMARAELFVHDGPSGASETRLVARWDPLCVYASLDGSQ